MKGLLTILSCDLFTPYSAKDEPIEQICDVFDELVSLGGTIKRARTSRDQRWKSRVVRKEKTRVVLQWRGGSRKKMEKKNRGERREKKGEIREKRVESSRKLFSPISNGESP